MNIPTKIETDETICQCFQVNESTIRAVIKKDNLTEIEQVTEKCEAGGGCHSCHILLQLFIDEHQKKNTECGIYSLYFIIKMIEGMNFNTLKSKIISDDDIFKYRNEFFN